MPRRPQLPPPALRGKLWENPQTSEIPTLPVRHMYEQGLSEPIFSWKRLPSCQRSRQNLLPKIVELLEFIHHPTQYPK